MTSAPEAHKTAGVPPEAIEAAAKAMFEHLGGTRFADDLQGVYATIYPEGFRTLAMIALGAAGVTGIATRLGRPLTVEEDADLLEAEWSGSEASVSRVTNRILASRSTPSVPAVAELSGGLALGVAGAAEGNLLTAAKKALAFYDSLDREHDPGEAAVLDALDTAVRAALTASPAGDDPKALSAEARYVRHKKRGTTYRVIGIGKMQAEGWTRTVAIDQGIRMVAGQASADMAEVVTYQCLEDGALWVRPVAEFEDGRFEDVPAPEGIAEARSSSTEAVEQEVEKREIEADAACLRGFIATYGMTPTMAVAGATNDERRRCAGIAERWLSSPEGGEVYIARQIVDAILSRPSPVPAACKPEGAPSFPGKEEGR